MNRLQFDWYPKVYGAGDIDGAGLRKLLGASHHDALALLVRETIQNSWDASRAPDGSSLREGVTPEWTFELRTLDEDEKQQLRTAFPEATSVPGVPLGAALTARTVRVIEISDRGTSGLGGPTRPDVIIPEGVTTDFIDLIFNVGAPQNTEGGGGTYGFGKIAAFGVSECSTVVYRTMPTQGASTDDSGQHRLIASTIGDHFNHRGQRHTGRHWWGRTIDDQPQPLLGQEADDLAKTLFSHPLDRGETGTSILVLQPDLGDRDEASAVQHVVDAVLWNVWPKLVPIRDGETPPMRLSVLHNGREIQIPDPAAVQPFSGFVDALRHVRARSMGEVPPSPVGRWTVNVEDHLFESARPEQVVGHVGVARMWGAPPAEDDGDEGLVPARHFDGPARHLALLREPELVVRYMEGPPLNQPGTQWCAVFKPVRELDEHFAEAEPPSHDDWLVGRVKDRHGKIFVKRGREHGPAELFRSLHPQVVEDAAQGGTHQLARIADSLGHLLVTGERSTSKPRGPGRPPKPRKRTVVVEQSAPVALADGAPGVRVDFYLERAAEIRIATKIALAGGATDESEDLSDRRPVVVGVTREDDPPRESSPRPLGRLASGNWHLWVRNAGRVALSIDIDAVGED
jgi:hypothetical protein